MTPEEIYAESFRIIEAEAGGHPFDAMEWPVVRRMVHASGDLEVLRCVAFTGGAAAAGVAALRDGVAIVADVGMVAAGISKPHAAALSVAVRCFIDDPDVREQAAARGLTGAPAPWPKPWPRSETRSMLSATPRRHSWRSATPSGKESSGRV